MSKPLSVVAVVGSLHAPSKTGALVDAILAELAGTLPIDPHVMRISELGPLFAGTLVRSELPLGIYAHDSDFTDYRVTNPLLADRIANAVRRGLPLVRSSLGERGPDLTPTPRGEAR